MAVSRLTGVNPVAVRPRYLAAAIVIAEDTIVATAAADDDDDKYNPKTRITAKEIVSAHIMNSILPLRDGYNLLLFFW